MTDLIIRILFILFMGLGLAQQIGRNILTPEDYEIIIGTPEQLRAWGILQYPSSGE